MSISSFLTCCMGCKTLYFLLGYPWRYRNWSWRRLKVSFFFLQRKLSLCAIPVLILLVLPFFFSSTPMVTLFFHAQATAFESPGGTSCHATKRARNGFCKSIRSWLQSWKYGWLGSIFWMLWSCSIKVTICLFLILDTVPIYYIHFYHNLFLIRWIAIGRLAPNSWHYVKRGKKRV